MLVVVAVARYLEKRREDKIRDEAHYRQPTFDWRNSPLGLIRICDKTCMYHAYIRYDIQ